MSPGKRVLVLGGGGFLGRRVVAALGRAGFEAVAGGRRFGAGQGGGGGDGVRIDLNEPSTFGAMRGFDAVVDCADSTAAPPDDVVASAVHDGVLFVEATASTATLVRLFERWRNPLKPRFAPGHGVLVLGAGLFPGVSNLLAAEAAGKDGSSPPERLEVAVRLTPFSGAGPGTCAVAAEMLVNDSLRYEAGRLTLEPPLTPGPMIDFAGGRRRTQSLGLAEALMLHWSTGAPSTGAYVDAAGPLPVAPDPVLRAVGALVRSRRSLRAAVRRTAGGALRLLRARLLRDRPIPVELVAIAGRSADRPGGATVERLAVADGFAATAEAIAGTVALLAERGRPAPGCYLPDELFRLDDLAPRITGL